MASTDATPRTVAPAPSAPGRRPARRSRRRGSRAVAIAFLLPALAVNLLVIGGPGASSFFYALTDWDGFTTPSFTGLENVTRLVADSNFWNAISHNAIYLLTFITVPMAMGLGAAFMLSRIRRGTAPLRVIYFVPYLFASVVTAQVWKNLLSPSSGIASALNKIGITALDDVFFFGDTRLALFSVMAVDVWQFWGFLVVLFLAAMQGIDPSRFEAARIDGANAWHEFWHIALPGIRPTLTFAFMIISLWSLLTFNFVFVLTGGGPAGSSDVVALLVNRVAFEQLQAGYATAIALAMSFLGALLLVIFHFIRRGEEEGL